MEYLAFPPIVPLDVAAYAVSASTLHFEGALVDSSSDPALTLSVRRSLLTRLAIELVARGERIDDLDTLLRFQVDTKSIARLRRSMRSSANRSSTAGHQGVEVLDGLGGLLIDASVLPPERIEGRGWEVIPPFDVYAPQSVSTGCPGPPDPWHLKLIGAVGKKRDGNGVLVGVLDTGIDASHPEFRKGQVTFRDFSPREQQTSAVDYFDHGTHVSGLIAGRTMGVAPKARLAMAAVLTGKRHGHPWGSSPTILRGLNWLLAHPFRRHGKPGVDVINASLYLRTDGYVPYLYSALARARWFPGTLLIGAIGDFVDEKPGHSVSPGNYDVVVGVGASTQFDEWAYINGWGPVPGHPRLNKPDLVAPGIDVWSCVPRGGYCTKTGTSMAAPIVTGVAALKIAKCRSLATNAPLLQSTIESMATVPVRSSPWEGGGCGRIAL